MGGSMPKLIVLKGKVSACKDKKAIKLTNVLVVNL
jgi:hypothetical protein